MRTALNRQRKHLTRDQVAAKQDKAVRFLRDVAHDDDKADEIEDMSLEEYANHKKIDMVSNPKIGTASEITSSGGFFGRSKDAFQYRIAGKTFQFKKSKKAKRKKIPLHLSMDTKTGEVFNPGSGRCRQYRDRCVPMEQFAYVDDPEKSTTYKLRLDNATHVRDAMSRFGRTLIPDRYRRAVVQQIAAAGDKFGIDSSNFRQKYLGKKNPARYEVLESGDFVRLDRIVGMDSLREAKKVAAMRARKFPHLREVVADAKTGKIVYAAPFYTKNPTAAAMYETFHGKEPQQILDYQSRLEASRDLAALGDLIELVLEDLGREISFEGDEVILCSNPDGTQLFLTGGNQDISAALNLVDQAGKEWVDLGKVFAVTYRTRKRFDKFQVTDYVHEFGEEGGEQPRLIYNAAAKQIYLVGGDYKIEAPGIIN